MRAYSSQSARQRYLRWEALFNAQRQAAERPEVLPPRTGEERPEVLPPRKGEESPDTVRGH